MRNERTLVQAARIGLFGIAMLVGMFIPSRSDAGHDQRRVIEFLGFKNDGKQYLLMIRDEQMGTFLSVRDFETGKQVKGYPIENPQDEKALTEEVVKKHRITDPGTASQASPDGTYTIIGVPRGIRFDLNVLRGNRSARLKTLKVETGASGPATVTLKGVHWSQDGHRIVVILHKVLKDENGLDMDEALPFLFFASNLSFQ